MLKHECEDCNSEASVCYCQKHFDEALEEAKKKAYDEGFSEGEKSALGE